MSRQISNDLCDQCGQCARACPHNAIDRRYGSFRIIESRCKHCDNTRGNTPFCVLSCPMSLPMSATPRRGRGRVDEWGGKAASPWPNAGCTRIASCLPVWEVSSLLSQGRDACQGEHPRLLSERRSAQILLGLSISPALQANSRGEWTSSPASIGLSRDEALQDLDRFDPRTVALHLILAAAVMGVRQPWSDDIHLDDRMLEQALGLNRRRDMNRPQRLSLLKTLALQLSRVRIDLRCEPLNGLPSVEFHHEPFWHLLAINHHFQNDSEGRSHLSGLHFRFRAGAWSRYFLDVEGQSRKRALYQYTAMPAGVPRMVCRHWQQHPGAMRLLVWLVFKLKLGRHQKLLVATLMRIGHGSQRLEEAKQDRESRKRLLRSYETDLLVLTEEGLRPRFHPQLYPEEIRPLWVALDEVPDDPEKALHYWTTSPGQNRLLDGQGVRNKFQRLLEARIEGFQLEKDWSDIAVKARSAAQDRCARQRPDSNTSLPPERIRASRTALGLSQRDLARLLHRSQSWVRDLESGRCRAGEVDQMRLIQALGL